MAEALRIQFEDNHCLAVWKPAGVPTTHYQGREETLDRQAKAYLKAKYQKPGNVFLGVVHRLDKPVSGVVLFARTSKAAARLAEQFREGTAEKVYWAVVEGVPEAREGTLLDHLAPGEGARRVVVAAEGAVGARRAELEYRVLRSAGGLSLLEVRPRTGRKHQIRVQLAHAGWPIYGDTRYGARSRFGLAIALHARNLTVRHPVRSEPLRLTAEPPAEWRRVFAALLDEAERD